MNGSAVTPERFAKGMTFEEYARYVGTPDNLAREAWGGYFPDSGSIPTARKDNSAVFRERYARARLSEHQAAAIKWLAADTEGAHGEGTPMRAATGISFRTAPAGYVLSWHCAPRRQYSITLSGQAEIEVGDGPVARIGPGDVVLAEDLTG